jgi:multimeric flavodoxin WrbA
VPMWIYSTLRASP